MNPELAPAFTRSKVRRNNGVLLGNRLTADGENDCRGYLTVAARGKRDYAMVAV
jgi:hypothetical protein